MDIDFDTPPEQLPNFDTTTTADVEAIETEAKNLVTQPEPESKVPQKSEIMADDKGALIGENLSDQYRLAQMYLAGGVVPKCYKNATQVIAGLQYAISIGEPPVVASLDNIAPVGGRMMAWGELPLKRVRKSGQLLFIDEYLLDEELNRIDFVVSWDQIFAAVCEVQRVGEEKRRFTFTKYQAEKGIQGVRAIWDGYYSVMMKRKVRAIALKDVFTDILGAVQIAEYDQNVAPDIPSTMAPANQTQLKSATEISAMIGGSTDEPGK